MPLARIPHEITERIAGLGSEDWLGFRREVLVSVLCFDDAEGYLADGVTEEQWTPNRITDIDAAARSYYEFALGKIEDHRGISASRSVEKLREYAWLLGRDDAVTAMDEKDYAMYGAPQVKAFAMAMGYEWPDHDESLNRMAEGKPCESGCEDGC